MVAGSKIKRHKRRADSQTGVRPLPYGRMPDVLATAAAVVVAAGVAASASAAAVAAAEEENDEDENYPDAAVVIVAEHIYCLSPRIKFRSTVRRGGLTTR